MDSSSRGRRRSAAFVTRIACTECRKKRAKCDGITPCSRCVSQGGLECVYKVPTQQSKADMRKEISQLRAHQRQTNQILALLTSHEHSKEVLDQLRNGETLQNITARRRSLSLTSAPPANVPPYTRFSDRQAINNTLEPSQSIGKIATTAQLFQEALEVPSYGKQNDPSGPGSVWLERGAESGNPSDHRDPNQNNDSWTTITRDGELVEHLLALYFCWEYPIFASLSKQYFLEDFKQGISRYCSHLLVNALLAFTCRWSDRPSTRADPKDSATAGDHFFSEALKLLKAEKDHRVLTTIQALGIMSVREASCGRASKSMFFSGQSIRLAIEMGLHLDAEDCDDDEAADADDTVRRATFWGAFSLDEAWSLCSGKMPHFSFSTNLTIKPAVIQSVESQPWIPYTDDGASLELNYTQLSNIRSIYKTFCELSEIVHRTLYTLYTPGSHTISEVLLDAYSQHILWYDTIPDALRLGDNFTPAVLFAHLYYHFAILMLFRPFVRLRIIASDISPRHICTQAANTISTIMRSYSNLYTLQRTPAFVPYIVLSSSIFHLAIVHDDTTNVSNKDQLAQNISDLKEMSSRHGIAARGLDILRFLAQLWKVDGIFHDTHEGVSLQNHSHPSFILMGELSPLTGSVSMMHNIVPWPSPAENPLYAPFPIQGRPSVALGSELEEDGFALVHKEV